jgi:predicted anti-sigma-YlaC factor YlaD
MDCRRVQSRLIDWIDGDLAPVLAEDMRDHLNQCPECRREADALADFLQNTREFLACPGSVYSFRHLRARMAEIEPLEEIAAFLPRLRVNGLIPRLAVSAVLMALLGMMPASIRESRASYSAMKTPFNDRADTIDAACGEFPGMESDDQLT